MTDQVNRSSLNEDEKTLREYITAPWKTTISRSDALGALATLEAALQQARDDFDEAMMRAVSAEYALSEAEATIERLRAAIREYVEGLEAPQGEHLYDGAWQRLKSAIQPSEKEGS
jgi:F0F1-type ATP synthase epsilon subunit